MGHRGNRIRVGRAVCNVRVPVQQSLPCGPFCTLCSKQRSRGGADPRSRGSMPWNPHPSHPQARWGEAQIMFLCCTFSVALGTNWPGSWGPVRDWKPDHSCETGINCMATCFRDNSGHPDAYLGLPGGATHRQSSGHLQC